MNDIKTVIAEYSEQFNRRLPDFFPLPDGPEKRVVEAMKYAVTNGGKRLRPYLVYETARLFGVDFSSSLRTAVALEMLHSYSLCTKAITVAASFIIYSTFLSRTPRIIPSSS